MFPASNQPDRSILEGPRDMTVVTQKQEKFAQLYVERGNASEAYRQAYDVSPDCKPETIWCNASKTLSDTKVSQRVMQLQHEHCDRHNITIDMLTEELNEARKLAMSDPKGASAAVSATMGKARLHGFLVDRKEFSGKIETTLPKSEISDMEAAKRIAFILSRAERKLNGQDLTNTNL